MKYRYYLHNEEWASWYGTNDESVAIEASRDDQWAVIDAETGEQMAYDTIGERFDIAEYKA